MPIEKSVSFRSDLLSNTTDLLSEAGLECTRTARLIAGFVSQLAALTEEGVPLSPTVYICNSIVDLTRRAGVGEFVPLAQAQMDSAASKVLKTAAPLCNNNWRIYVERGEDGSCRYGVFCGSNDPSSLTAEEVLLESVDRDFPIIKIAQTATNRVEIRANSGGGVEFRFNDDADVSALTAAACIRSFADAAAADCGDQHAPFARFLERLLSFSIDASHGTLLAVVPRGGAVPQEVRDHVALSPPFALYDRFRSHLDEGKTAVSVGRLQTAVELVSGLIRSDGVTLFTSEGSVLGYRGFVQMDNATPQSSGGARSRAYETLCPMVGEKLSAAFFRSQDGHTKVKTRSTDVSHG